MTYAVTGPLKYDPLNQSLTSPTASHAAPTTPPAPWIHRARTYKTRCSSYHITYGNDLGGGVEALLRLGGVGRQGRGRGLAEEGVEGVKGRLGVRERGRVPPRGPRLAAHVRDGVLRRRALCRHIGSYRYYINFAVTRGILQV